MSDSPKPWSTLKVLLVGLVITFTVMFFGNGIFNEVLELGVPSWVFSSVAGLAMFPVILKWSVYQEIVANARKRKEKKSE